MQPPIWKKFVNVSGFAERNRSAIADENRRLREEEQAGPRAKSGIGTVRFDLGGGVYDERDAEELEDDPVYGGIATEALFKKELKTWRDQADSIDLELSDPSKPRKLTESQRAEILAEGAGLQENNPRHAELKNALMTDEEIQAKEKAKWEAKKRLQELGQMGVNGYRQQRVQSRLSEAAKASQAIAEQEQTIAAREAEGVKGRDLPTHAQEKAQVMQQKQVVETQKQSAAGAILADDETKKLAEWQSMKPDQRLAKKLQDSKLFSGVTQSIGIASDKSLVRRPDGSWDTPAVVKQYDNQILNAVKSGLTAVRAKAGLRGGGTAEETQAMNEALYQFQQENNLSDEEVVKAWNDFTARNNESWQDDEKLRVLSDGEIVLNASAPEILDRKKLEQVIQSANAPDEQKAHALENLEFTRKNVAEQRMLAYEAAGVGIESPSEYAARTNRDAGVLNNPDFILEYEQNVINAEGEVAKKARGLAADVVLGFNKLATTVLGAGAQMTNSETLGQMAAAGSEGGQVVGEGKPDTGLAGAVVQEAPSLAAMVVGAELIGVAGAAAGVGATAMTWVSRAGSLAMAGGQSLGATYADERAQGKSHEEAEEVALRSGLNTAIITGVFNALPGMSGFEKYTGGAQKKVADVTMRDILKSTSKQEFAAQVSKFARDKVLAGVSEGLEEGIDELTNAFINAKPDTNLSTAWKNAVEAAKVGALIGTGVDVVGSTGFGNREKINAAVVAAGGAEVSPEEERKLAEIAGGEVDPETGSKHVLAMREIDEISADAPELALRASGSLKIARGATLDELTTEEITALGVDRTGKALGGEMPAMVEVVNGRPILLDAAIRELETAAPSSRGLISMTEGEARQKFAKQKFTVTSKDGAVVEVEARNEQEASLEGAKQFKLGDPVDTVTPVAATGGAVSGKTPAPIAATPAGANPSQPVASPTAAPVPVSTPAAAVVDKIRAKSKGMAKLITVSADPAVRVVATEKGIFVNPDALMAEAQANGLDDKQAAEWVGNVIDEEVRHMAQYRAAESLWKKSKSGMPYEAWRDAHYGAMWESEFVATGKAEIVRKLYGEDAFGALAPWQQAMEGIRMMWQQNASQSQTEVAKLWTQVTEKVLAELKAILEQLKALAKDDALSPQMKRELALLQKKLKEIESVDVNKKPSGAKQAASPSNNAPQPFTVGQRIEGTVHKDDGQLGGQKISGVIAQVTPSGEVLLVNADGIPRPVRVLAKDAKAVEVKASKPKEWEMFASETGTLGIPRAEMPQIKAEDRSAMVQFLKARGIDYNEETVDADTLTPSQAEYSPAKVQKARDYEGGNRAILISADNYVVDGHHQWLAADGGEIRVIRLMAPIQQVLETVKEMPSATTAGKGQRPAQKPAEKPASPPAASVPAGQDSDKLSATLSFPSREAAQAFAKAWGRHSTRGHDISSTGADGVTSVTVYGVTEADQQWIDSFVASQPTAPLYSVREDADGRFEVVNAKDEPLFNSPTRAAAERYAKDLNKNPLSADSPADNLTEGERALRDALDGLFAAPLGNNYAANLPPDRIQPLVDVAIKMIGENTVTPESLADSLDKIAESAGKPKALRKYSYAIWQILKSIDTTLDDPNWNVVYGDEEPSILAEYPTIEFPVAKLQLSKDVPQFKGNAGADGVVEKLEGKYERLGTGAILVWLRANGDFEVISGHHRFRLAKDTNEKTIPAQIVREKDGFTRLMALTADAELNIRDGQGTIQDYANYFRTSEITESSAKEKGLLGRAKGRAGWTIGAQGSQEVFDLHQNNRISDAVAEAIASTAPGDPALQAVGLKTAMSGAKADMIRNVMMAARQSAAEKASAGVQGDLFGFDDSAMREMENQAKIATRNQKEIREQIASVSGAAKRPEQAAKMGVDVKDPEGVNKRIAELKAELARWENWPMHSDLVAITRGAVSANPSEVSSSPALPPSKMDIKAADSKELFADDGGFALTPETTLDGDKLAAEKAKADAAKEAADKAQGKLFDEPEQSAGDKAILDTLDGLFAAPLAPSYTDPIPADRMAKLMNAAGILLSEGVNSPEALASRLGALAEGRLKPFTQSIWFAMKAVGAKGAAEPDWSAIYAPADKKQSEEQRELEMVLAAREIVQGEGTEKTKYDQLVEAYENMPALNAKTSTSKINQAFSTPIPMAYAASIMGDLKANLSTSESSGGHASLLMEVKADNPNVNFNELNPRRLERVKTISKDWKFTNNDATTQVLPEKVKRVAGNPPFGSITLDDGTKKVFTTEMGETTTIDHAILLQDLFNMDEDGRAVFIIGGPPPLAKSEKGRREYYSKGAASRFFEHLYENYGVIDHVTVNGDLYKKQGAGWPVDIIVIQGKSKSKTSLPSAKVPRMLNTWDEVFNQSQLTDNERIQSRTLTEAEVSANIRGLADDLAGIRGQRDADADDGPRAVPNGRPTGQQGAGSGVRSGSNEATPDRPNADIAPDGQPGSDETGTGQRLIGRLGDGNQSDSRGSRQDASSKPVTKFQSKYTPFSEGNTLDTLIPSNMADAVIDAFERIKKDVGGDLVAFVKRELGYKPGEDINKHFAGEQIDALAAAIWNFERGGALIVGDQTGIGKGRIAAGLMRYAVNKGLTPVFVTEKPNLLDSMLRGDLADIDADTIVKPSILLAEMSKFEEGKKRKLPFGKKYFERVSASGKLGEGANAIFTLYSQIQADTDSAETKETRDKAKRNGEAPRSGWRTAALQRLAPNAVFILDESHNAAGASITGFRMAEILAGSSRVYYSSATSAKRPENMGIYFKTNIGKVTNGSMEKLTEIMQAGGVPAMQLGSYMLARDGQYLRRERSFEGIKFETTITTDTAERDAALADNLTFALRQIVKVQERMMQVAEVVNDRIASVGKGAKIPASNRTKLESANFSSKVHNVVSQYLLAIKTKAAVAESIKAVREGKKVVVGLSNTMESAIDDLRQFMNDPDTDFTMTYKGLVMRYLDKMRTMKNGKEEFVVSGAPSARYKDSNTDDLFMMAVRKEGRGEDGTVSINQEVVEEIVRRYMWDEYTAARDQARRADLGDLPLSPIDAMRQAMEEYGVRTGEITGRTTGIDTNGEIYERSESEVKLGGVRYRDAFNDEDLDFLVINQSGSTGINLHASEKAKNKKPRKMIVVQPALDINTFMQMLGRIHRSGQVELPEFSLLQTALPAEFRPAAILAVKMAMLNANTTSNAKSDVSEGNQVTDMFNKYGDAVVYAALERDPDLQNQLAPFGSIFKKIIKDEGGMISFQEAKEVLAGQVDGYIARAVTGYLAVLPVEEQQMFWDKITAEYNAMIDYLNEMGQNDLESKALELKAKTTSREVFTGGGQGDSVFEEPSYVETVETAIGKQPITGAKAVEVTKAAKLEMRKISDDYYRDATQKIEQRIQQAKAKAVKWNAEKEAKMRGDMIESRNTIANALRLLGAMGSIKREDGSTGLAVIESVKLDPEKPFAPGSQVFTLQVNDGRRTLKISASKIKEAFEPQFESASEWDSTTFVGSTRNIVTGNLLAAIDKLKGTGQIISYTTDADETKMGVLLPAGFTKRVEAEKGRTRNLKTIEDFAKAFADEARVTTVDKAVKLLPVEGGIEIRVPASRSAGGKYWTKPALNALMNKGEFLQISNDMRATFPMDRLQQVIDLIGEPFVAVEKVASQDDDMDSSLQAAPLSSNYTYREVTSAGFTQYIVRAANERTGKMENRVFDTKAEAQAEMDRIDELSAPATDDDWAMFRSGLAAAPLSPAPFYSQLARVIDEKLPKVANAGQVMQIAMQNAKAEEVKWSGLQQALVSMQDEKGKVTKEAVLEYLANEGMVRFEEVVTRSEDNSPDVLRRATYETMVGFEKAIKGDPLPEKVKGLLDGWLDGSVSDSAIERELLMDPADFMREERNKRQAGTTKYSQYVLPGGENYREVVLAMPEPEVPKFHKVIELPDGTFEVTDPNSYGIPMDNRADAENQARYMNEKRAGGKPATYTSSHFPDVPNYVAHMRTNERDNGLFIEELQSDRHQEGRKKGYRDGQSAAEFLQKRGYDTSSLSDSQITNEASAAGWSGIPDAPFRTTWPLALFKRALRDAVAGGKEWIGWTTGETQSDRFDLSKQIRELSHIKNDDGTYDVIAITLQGEQVVKEGLNESQLEDFIGKEVGQKVVNGEGSQSPASKMKILSGLDLKTESKGMIKFYDKMVPSEIGKYVKQWGAKVEKSSLLNPDKRATVQYKQVAQEMFGRPASELNDSELRQVLTETSKRESDANSTPIWRVDITDAMRKGVSSGQALFAAPLSPNRDDEYLSAVQSGDMETAQRMVDEAFGASPIDREVVGEIVDDGVVEKTAYLNGAKVTFEESNKVVWILDVGTPVEERNRGQAKSLVWHLLKKGKTVEWGEFLEDGSNYLKRYVGLSAAPVTYDEAGNVIPLSRRFNPASNSILEAAPLMNEDRIKEIKAQQDEFGNAVKPPNRASIGDETTRKAVDVFDIEYEERREKETRQQWVDRGTDLAKNRRKELIENAKANAYGEVGAVPLRPEDIVGTQIVIEQMVKEANGSYDKLIEAGTLIQAYRTMRSNVARVLASGWDRTMKPDERNRRFLANAILTLPPKVAAAVARKHLSPSEAKAEMRRELQERLTKIDKALKEYGVTVNEVLNKQVYLTLDKKNIVKDIMKDSTKDEALAIRMHQQNADAAKIAKACHMTIDEVQKLVKRVYDEAMARMIEKARAGMTLETSGLQAASLLTEEQIIAEARRMVEIGLGISPTVHTPSTRALARKARVKVESAPEKINWSRPEFNDGLNGYTFNDKDLAEIKRTTQALIDATAATAKVETLTGKKRQEADAMLAKIESILAKYGTSVQQVVESGKPLESYRFDITDRVHVHLIANAIRSVDADAIDKGVEWYYFSMLSGLQTMMVNASSVVHGVFDATIGRGAEMILNAFLRNPMNASLGETKYILKAMGPMMSRARSNFAASYGAEAPFFEQDILGVPPDLESVLEGHGMYHRTAISGKKGQFIRIPTRVLLATDEFVKTINAMTEVGAMAYRICRAADLKPGTAAFDDKMKELVNVPGSLAWQMAASKAYNRTFTNALPGQKDPATGKTRETRTVGEVFGNIVGKTQGLLQSGPSDTMTAKLGKTMLRLMFFPFVKVPYNITSLAMTYTPLSLIDIATLYAQSRGIKGKAEKQKAQAEVIERMSRVMLGGILAGFMLGAGEGDDDDLDKPLLITGSRPYKDTKKGVRELGQRMGVDAYSISWKLPNGKRGVFHYGRIEPVATLLATTIDTMRELKQSGRGRQDYGEAMTKAVSSFTNQLSDKTFLKGIGDAYKTVMGEQNMSKFVADKLAMAVPNLIKQPIRETDPYFRDKADTFGEELLSAIYPSGIREPKVDIYGDKSTKLGNSLTRIFDFTDAGTVTIRKVDEMLWRYQQMNPDASGIPTIASDKYTPVTGEGQKEMTEKQARMYRERAGQNLTNMLKSRTFNYTNPTDRDIDNLNKLIDAARKSAKAALKYDPNWK